MIAVEALQFGLWGSQNRAEKNYDYQNQPRGIYLQRGGKEKCCKSRSQKGQFRQCRRESHIDSGHPDENCLTTSRADEMGVDWQPFLCRKGNPRHHRVDEKRDSPNLEADT